MGHAVAAPLGEMRPSGLAIASMVCGIVGILIFGIILGPIAIILGAMAKNQINRNPREVGGNCQAIAGIVGGSIATFLWIVVFLLVFGGFGLN